MVLLITFLTSIRHFNLPRVSFNKAMGHFVYSFSFNFQHGTRLVHVYLVLGISLVRSRYVLSQRHVLVLIYTNDGQFPINYVNNTNNTSLSNNSKTIKWQLVIFNNNNNNKHNCVCIIIIKLFYCCNKELHYKHYSIYNLIPGFYSFYLIFF